MIESIFLTEAFSASPKSICDAITNNRVISIQYQGAEEDSPGWRYIMPVTFGEDEKGRQAIRAWQPEKKRDGGSNNVTVTKVPAWKFFLVERIHNYNMSSNQNFGLPDSKYAGKGKDKHMRRIFCSSDFTTEKPNAEMPDKVDKLVDGRQFVIDLATKKIVKIYPKEKTAAAVDYAKRLNKGIPVTANKGYAAFGAKDAVRKGVEIPPVETKGKKVATRLKTMKEIYEIT